MNHKSIENYPKCQSLKGDENFAFCLVKADFNVFQKKYGLFLLNFRFLFKRK